MWRRYIKNIDFCGKTRASSSYGFILKKSGRIIKEIILKYL